MGFNMEAVAKLFKKSDAQKAAEKKEREARGKAKAK
nr:unnamed protein product [Brassica rapa]